MKIKHKELIIEKDNPFENCKLQREKYASILTNIVSRFADGFVLSINNKWGTGKTTFLKMWYQQLKNEDYQVLYFNAWENDFDQNPFTALVSEMKPLIKTGSQDKYKSLLKKGAIITKNILPHLLKALVKKHTGIEEFAELTEDSTESASQIFEEEVNEYSQKKEGLKDFKKSLEEFVDSIESKKPIIFIIDELDRCRPTYAVELLEQIKHLFSIKGIVFVLAIDKVQLSHAIRGVYGSELIDTDEYLRRFIDLEYSLPDPDIKLFSKYLYEYFDFDEFFSIERNKHYELKDDKENLIATTIGLFEKMNLSLRQQEKVFAHARIGLSSFKPNQYLFPSLYIILVFIKFFHSNLYSEIQKGVLNLEELTIKFKAILPNNLNKEYLNHFIYSEAMLVYIYFNSMSDSYNLSLIEKDEGTYNYTAIVKSKLDNSKNAGQFINWLRAFRSTFDGRVFKINFLLDRIDLLEAAIQ